MGTYIIIWLIIYLPFCFLASSLAKSRGRGGTDYFLLALFLSPVLAIIILLIVGETDQKRFEKVKQEEEIRTNVRKESRTDLNATPLTNKYESLDKLGNLLERGIISKEEFVKEKAIILSTSTQEPNVPIISEPENDRKLDSLINQLTSKPQRNKENDTEIKSEQPRIISSSEIADAASQLKELVDKEKKKGMFSKSVRGEILQLLNDFCVTREYCIKLIREYKSQFNANLIDDLKEITSTSSHDSIKEVLNVFIYNEIVEEKYPHEIMEVN